MRPGASGDVMGGDLFGGAYVGCKVLVTGHTGFKGSWLSSWLLDLGAEVAGYALEPDTEPSLFDDLGLQSRMSHSIGDVRDLDHLAATLTAQRPEVIFHMAAQPLVRRSYDEPLYTFDTNVIGTANVLETVRATPSVRAVVVVTTDKVYENAETGQAYIEGDPLGGFDPYSASKACAEIVTASYSRSFFGAPDSTLVATARAGNVIGGGDWAQDRLIPDCVRARMADEPVIVRNPGSVRPWQHVLEPLAGYLALGRALLEHNADAATAINFGPDLSDTLPVSRMVELFSEAWGSGEWETPKLGEQPHEAGLLTLDISKAAEVFDWEPVWNAASTVRAAAVWYRAYAVDPSQAGALVERDIAAYVESARKAGAAWTA